MKSILLPVFLWVSVAGRSAIIYWDGGAGDGLWNTAANWAGDIVPGIMDDVVLDQSLVTGSYTVELPGAAVTITIRSLSINPSASGNITLLLPASSMANPGLLVTGPDDALVLNKGAVLRNSSGATAGSGIVITNKFRINDGGRYVHNTRRANATIVSQLSAAAGTESGVFEFDVPVASYTLSLSNRIYGTLELSSLASGGTTTYIGTGANPLHINGELKINSGVVLNISMSADFIVHGNYRQASSSGFNIQSSSSSNIVRINGNVVAEGTITKSGTGLPVLELGGLVNQDISITGPVTNNVAFRVNNNAGITLTDPFLISYQLQLINGRIRTSSSGILTFADNATYTGGSAVSFIEGPVRKTGDDDFDFPVGTGEVYAPIGIAGTGGHVADEFIAEYKRGNPQSVPALGNSIAATIDHISYTEYWDLRRIAGTAAKTIRLTAGPYSFVKVLTSLLVARFGGGLWNDEGGTGFMPGPPAPPYITGNFTSATAINAFGAFTIGTTDNESINPLPVQLISFHANPVNTGKAVLSWELALGSPVAGFAIERAGRDRRFSTIAVMEGNANGRFYTYIDGQLKKGINYYRLKMMDKDSIVTYSRIAVVQNAAGGLTLVSLSPAIVSSKIRFDVVSSLTQAAFIMVVDMQGRVWRKQQQVFQTGNTLIELALNELPPGIYQVVGIFEEGKTNVIRFIKE